MPTYAVCAKKGLNRPSPAPASSTRLPAGISAATPRTKLSMVASKGSNRRYKPEGRKRRALAVKRELNKLGNSLDRIVKRIALDRCAARVADQLFDLIASHTAIRRCACAMDNAFFDNRSVQIIGAESQRNLR